MGNKSNTEIKVLTFYDGDTEAIDAFADVIRYKMRQRIRDGKKLKITNETDGIVCEGAYNIIYGDLPGRYGMDKDMMKINDDELENVSGGSWEENRQFLDILGTADPKKLESLLYAKYGIQADLFNCPMRNIYTDTYAHKPMTHEEVIKRLEESKFH